MQLIVESNARLLLSDGSDSFKAQISKSSGISLFNLQEVEKTLKNNIRKNVNLDSPAYIFFTSGSTGKPKGIVGSQKGLSHFIDWQRKTFSINSKDRCAQLTSVAFDVVLRSIFTPLCSGASVVIPSTRNLSAGDILPWMKKRKITMLHLVPSIAKLWLAENIKYKLPELRLVFFAGEKLHTTLLKKWGEVIFSRCQFINLYGPTETTLAKCYYVYKENDNYDVLPIGKPLPETSISIVNKEKSVCANGEAGEIVIKTPYCTLGYLKSEEPDKFKNGCFFTGDIGFYNKEGMLEIIGRKDHQIKYNGVRLEVEEIEILLNLYSNIVASAVTVKTYNKAEYLTAFLEIKNAVNVDDIRGYLKMQLPENIIPNLYISVDELPYTKSGKLDRKSLPNISKESSIIRNNTVSPEISSETERILISIWSDVLDIDVIGLNENFFTVGGNSLQAMRVLARISENLM